MVVTTDIATQTFLGNSVQTAFTTSFNPGASNGSDLVVSLSTSSTAGTILTSNLYSVSIGAPAVGELWANSAVITYPLSGSPISNTTYLTVSRIVPFTQDTSFTNQGNVWPAAVEISDDTLEMQIQQLAARTTQFRGIWATGIYYNYGDIVQDGANGSGTKNYYICQVPNTSGTWTTDLTTNAYWAISVLATVPTGSNSLTLVGDVTASGTLGTSITSTLATVNSNIGQFNGITVTAKGLVTAATALTGDVTTSGAAATLATVNSNVGSFTNANITVDGKGRITAASTGAGGSGPTLLQTFVVANTAFFTISSTYINSNYPRYRINFNGLYGTNNNNDLLMGISINNGQSIIKTGYGGGAFYNNGNSISGSNPGTSGTANLTFTSQQINNNPTGGNNGWIELANPGAIGFFSCAFFVAQSSGNEYFQGTVTNTSTTTPVNSIQFSLTAGNINGTFAILGIPGA